MIVFLCFGVLFLPTFGIEPQDASSTSFARLVNTKEYVDKTEFIVTFFHYCHVIITAPPQFGKTTNLQMLRAFLEIPDYGLSKRRPMNETKNYKIFSEKQLLIYTEHRMFFELHFGKLPVIFLDFKAINFTDFKTFITSFAVQIHSVYCQHKYLNQSEALSDYDKEAIHRFYDQEGLAVLPIEQLRMSISKLSFALFTHYNKSSVLLIDDVDMVIQRALSQDKADLKSIVRFVRSFLTTTLKTNQNIKWSLINSFSRTAELLIDDLSNINRFPFMMDEMISNFYGFTEPEVKDLMEKFNKTGNPEQVRDWYGGYRLVNRFEDCNYNPSSVVRYIKTKGMKKFWYGDVENLFLLLNKTGILNNLLKDFSENKEGVPIVHKRSFKTSDLMFLHDYVKMENFAKPDLFLHYLVDQGYLSIMFVRSKEAYVVIPNKEVKLEIDSIVEEHM